MNLKDKIAKAKALKAKGLLRGTVAPVALEAPVSRWCVNEDGIPIEGKIEGYTGHLDPYVELIAYPPEVYSHYLKMHRPGADKQASIKKALAWARANGHKPTPNVSSKPPQSPIETR
jgi:hypothetical protein